MYASVPLKRSVALRVPLIHLVRHGTAESYQVRRLGDHGNLAEDEAIHITVRRRGDADAERQRDQRHRGKSRRRAQHADSVAHVLPDLAQVFGRDSERDIDQQAEGPRASGPLPPPFPPSRRRTRCGILVEKPLITCGKSAGRWGRVPRFMIRPSFPACHASHGSRGRGLRGARFPRPGRGGRAASAGNISAAGRPPRARAGGRIRR